MRTSNSNNGEEKQRGGTRLERIFSAVLLLCLAILAIQFSIWSYRRFGPPPSAPAQSQNELRAGTHFPAVKSVDLSGLAVELRPAESGAASTVVVILTTTCPFCRVNVPIWNELHSALGGQVRFVALSLDDPERTKRFAETSRAEFPMLVVEDARSFVTGLGLQAVPQTFALDSEGVIRQVWGGGLSEDHVAGILRSIGELVPGLQLTPPAEGDTRH